MPDDLSIDILPAASNAIWREVEKLSRPLMRGISAVARKHGLHPNYLAWLIRSGEHWPRNLSDKQRKTLEVAKTLLWDTGVGAGSFDMPSLDLSESNPTDQAFQDLTMADFKKGLAQAYIAGLRTQLRRVKQWNTDNGHPPWSDRDAQMFLHGALQNEIRVGGRGIFKSLLIWDILQVIS